MDFSEEEEFEAVSVIRTQLRGVEKGGQSLRI